MFLVLIAHCLTCVITVLGWRDDFTCTFVAGKHEIRHTQCSNHMTGLPFGVVLLLWDSVMFKAGVSLACQPLPFLVTAIGCGDTANPL